MGNETTSAGEAPITSYGDHKSGGHYHSTILDTAAPFLSLLPASLGPRGDEVSDRRGEQMGEVWTCILSEKKKKQVYFSAGRFL